MPKELYKSGNYIVADDNGTRMDYPILSIYSERGGVFTLTHPNLKKLIIAFTAAGEWTDAEGGGAAYTEQTMRDFLRANTGFRTASGGSGAIGAKLIQSGQTTIWRTNDDGDNQEGREVDFYTLSSNNPFGNTNRFTDELGGQTYTNRIIIDWSTYDGSEVIGWYDGATPVETWNNAIDNSALLTVGGFAVWRIPNVREAQNIQNFGLGQCWNYPPFNNTTWSVIWTSTTYASGASNAQSCWVDANTFERAKGATSTSVRCRTFTKTELGI
jgi:hypothetical protein